MKTFISSLTLATSLALVAAGFAADLPAQHQAITGLAPAAPSTTRVFTVASPLPDAINMHIVRAPRGLVLFDALRRAHQAEDIVRVIERLDAKPLALFITHAHTDHFGGITFLRQRFPDLPIYAAPAITREMRDDPGGQNARRRAMFGDDFPTQAQINANLPNREIKDKTPVDIGGLRIVPLVFGESESAAATVFLLPQLNIAVTGDLVNVLTVSAPVESLDNWLGQLDKVERAVNPDTTLYVGHGPSGPARPLIAEQRGFLVAERNAVRAALKGDNVVSLAEREAIVLDLRLAYPHYRGAAAMPPDDLMRRGIEWVAKQEGGRAEKEAVALR